MARRTRSFLFDNISKRLVQNTNKTAREINSRKAANTVANTDILTSLETDTKISTTISNTGINTLSDISIANVVSDQVLQYNANTGNWENETLSLVSSVDGLTDTSLSNVQRDDYLKYDGSNWINSALDLSSYVTDTDIAAYSNTAQMNTAIASSNTAMKNYVDAEVAGVVNSAPSTLDTLNELAAALGDDPDFATTTATNIGTKLAKSSNLSDLTNAATARTNLGLGTAATTASTDYATSAQGTKADTAHGWGNHASAGYGTSNFSGAYADLTGKPSLFSGSYNDLSNKPTIPTNTNQLTNGSGYITGITSSMVTTALGFTPGTSSFSGSYNDLSNKPTIPTNNNQLTNGAGYVTSSSLSGYVSRNFEDSSRNLVIPTNTTSASGGIALETSNGAWLFQLYGTGTVYGFLQSQWGAWDIQKAVNGQMQLRISGTDYTVYHTGNLPTIPTNNNQLTNGAGYITNGANYNVNNAWLREQGDNANVQLYGNSRQMVFRTDGTTEYSSGVGGYPFVWMYGGNGSAQRKMYLTTGGNLGITGTMTTGGNINVPSDTGPATSGNWIRNTTGYGYIQLGPANSGHAHIYTDRSNFYFNKTNIQANGNAMWHAGNDGSGSGLDADTLDGLQLNSSTVNNQANAVVRTQANGYIHAGWINSVSGSSGTSSRLTRITASYDAYLRYLDPASFKVQIGASYKNTYSRSVDYSTDSNYWVGSFGHNTYNANQTFHAGSGFFDIWSGSNYPSGTSHIHGFNALHYTVGSISGNTGNAYGWQMAAQYNQDSGPWWRRCSAGSFTSWRKIWHDSNDGSGSGLDADLLDGYHLTSQDRNNQANRVVRTEGTGRIYGGQFWANDWFRPEGTSGLYFQSYGGGWHMTDSTWIRAYNGKAIYATNTIATSANICAYYSDERLKTITGHIDNALDKVLSLDGFYYVENELAKELGYNNDKQQVGVSAQKVQAVLPEAVELAPVDYETDEHDGTITSKSGENYLTVDYSKMVPLLIEAIKEQQKQIEELKEKLG